MRGTATGPVDRLLSKEAAGQGPPGGGTSHLPQLVTECSLAPSPTLLPCTPKFAGSEMWIWGYKGYLLFSRMPVAPLLPALPRCPSGAPPRPTLDLVTLGVARPASWHGRTRAAWLLSVFRALWEGAWEPGSAGHSHAQDTRWTSSSLSRLLSRWHVHLNGLGSCSRDPA